MDIGLTHLLGWAAWPPCLLWLCRTRRAKPLPVLRRLKF